MVWNEILIGVTAGVTIILVKMGIDHAFDYLARRRIFKFMEERTGHAKKLSVGWKGDPRFLSTNEISANTNIPPDRVRFLCDTEKKIRRITKESPFGEGDEGKWAIAEFLGMR